MLTEFLVMRFSGVMQSWGYNSEYTYRNTSLFPTRSAVLGLCCAAKGLSRGSLEEEAFLKTISDSPMTAVALPRTRKIGEQSRRLHVRRIDDFHTVENTKTAAGKHSKNAVMTYRQYLCDADFLVILEVSSDLAEEMATKLSDPQWGVWLGRKSCIPSAPVFAGVFATIEALSDCLLEGKPLSRFTRQQEVASWEEGTDSLMDNPIDYDISRRERGLRRVKICEAEI